MTPETTPRVPADMFGSRRLRAPWVALATILAVVWLYRLGASFWVDEAGTFWVIKDGFSDMVDRSLRFQGQSPLFYSLAWLTRSVFGDSEIVLRMPSLLASIIAAFFLFRLTERLLTRSVALLTTVVFVAMEWVRMIGTDARPYSLALALSIGATYGLVRWLDTGERRYAVTYVPLAAAILYAHYLFAFVLICHLAYSVARIGRSQVSTRAMLAAGIGVVVLLMPLVPQLIFLLDRRHALSIPSDLGFRAFVRTILPLELMAAMVAVLIARLFGRLSTTRDRPDGATLILVLTWAFLPVVGLYAFSLSSDVAIFLPRYFVSAAPGFAMLCGWLLDRLDAQGGFRFAALSALVIGMLVLRNPFVAVHEADRHREEWRDAAAYVNSVVDDVETPLLIRAGFIESQQVEWLTESEKSSWLLAPIYVYPMAGRPIPMPLHPTTDALEEYILSALEREAFPSDRLLSVMNYDSYGPWLYGVVENEGFRVSEQQRFGTIFVSVFERP